tara:strand:- start:2483 stop:2677 length:195 start_codon:yes stop_codon:yes gene_type:complete
MGLQTLGYYGSALSKRSKRKKKHMETLCHEHYTEKLNQMGINPNTLHADDPRSSTYGATFGMSY